MADATCFLVTVVQARGLRSAEFLSKKADPFAEIHCGKAKLATHVIKNCLEPVWNKPFELNVAKDRMKIAKKCKIEIYDKDRFTSNDLLGSCEFDLTAFKGKRQAEVWYPLVGKKVAKSCAMLLRVGDKDGERLYLEEQKRLEEARRAEEDKRRATEEARLAAEAARHMEEELRRAEEDRLRKEEEKKQLDAKAKADAEARRRAEDARRREEDARRKAEEERREAEERRKLEEDLRRAEFDLDVKETKAQLADFGASLRSAKRKRAPLGLFDDDDIDEVTAKLRSNGAVPFLKKRDEEAVYDALFVALGKRLTQDMLKEAAAMKPDPKVILPLLFPPELQKAMATDVNVDIDLKFYDEDTEQTMFERLVKALVELLLFELGLFVKMMKSVRAKVNGATTYDEDVALADAFKSLDKDGNGVLDANEFKMILTQRGSAPLDDDLVDELLKQADQDGDGQINLEEFVNFLHSM